MTANFNTRAASLALAAAVAAIIPIVKGYFCVSMEIGNDILASVGGVTTPNIDILTSRVWSHDNNGNEVEMPEARIDTVLIETALETMMTV